MEPITFWKDKPKKKINPRLFSEKAENLAKLFDSEGYKINKRTQIRKFYDEVVRLNMAAKAPDADWDDILPFVHMLTAKAAYAKGRGLISESFLQFIRGSVNQVEDSDDLTVFTNLFEAFYGFYRMYRPSNN